MRRVGVVSWGWFRDLVFDEPTLDLRLGERALYVWRVPVTLWRKSPVYVAFRYGCLLAGLGPWRLQIFGSGRW